MLISDLFEQESKWQAFGRGFGQELARRYVPDIEFAKSKPKPIAQPVTATQPQPVSPTTVSPAPVAPTQTRPQSTVQVPTAPASPQPTAKPRVPVDPIRVGNKIYRPGDPMHARLWQMMQAQQRS
jgi:cell division septation protein DedD